MPIDLSALFAAYIIKVIGKEGAYSNDPRDSGGETMWGITAARARAAGYTGLMHTMTQAEAIAIYRLYYWIQPGFDQIALIDQDLGMRLLDAGVNCGQATAGAWLQKALNVLNQGGTDYPDIAEDGACGAMTRFALNAYTAKRGADGRKVLLFMVKSQQSVNYLQLAKDNPKNEAFEQGWQLQRAM